MAVADTIATRARCIRAQVGAVIITPDNRVNSISYNGPAAGLPYKGSCGNWCPRAMDQEVNADYSACEAVHAEANAIARSDWTGIQGGTVYVSASSCVNCAKLVANSGVKRLVHAVRSESDLARGPDEVEDYLRRAGLEVTRWVR